MKIASVRLCSNALMQLAIPDALSDYAYTENMINENGRLSRQRKAVMEELDNVMSDNTIIEKALEMGMEKA